MSSPSHAAAGVPAMLKVTSVEAPPPYTREHDEWLLDEVLIETLPASDPIAVSPNSPGGTRTGELLRSSHRGHGLALPRPARRPPGCPLSGAAIGRSRP
jgi:hypothetical protein